MYPNMDADEELYIYGDMETDEKARWKFSNDRIDFGRPLPNVKGNFAVLRFVTLSTRSGKETIVAKMLKGKSTTTGIFSLF